MQTSNRHSAKRTIFGVLCAALLGGSLFAGGAKSVFADTIGDTLDNSALKVVNDSNGVPQVETTTGSYPGAQANQPWSMYSIPGLNRFRAPSEGSFVKYGYNAWGATGMPLAADISDGTSGDVLANTSAWKAKTTGSPVAITFKSSIKNHGSAFFSLNYVNKNNFVDFGSDDDAPDIAKAWAGKETTAAQDAKIFNQDNSVFSKMKDVNGQLQLDTSDPSNSFSNGYLQATGNVPIQAAVANSKSAVDATLAGDWAVMVRVQVANGIDAKALAASVDWAKSYYYLSIDTIQFLGIQGLGMYNINFPLQFDHHIYLSDNKNEFFLKVKGIPFNVLDESSGGLVDSVKARLQLQNGNSDYVDYLNNRAISSDHKNATTLDFLGTNNNVQTGSTDLNDNDLITRTDSGIQPTFSMQEGNWTISNNPIWDPYGGLLGNYPGHTSILANDLSPVYSTGSTGRMAALLNAACYNISLFGSNPSWRGLSNSLLGIRTLIVSAVSKFFTGQPFSGNAHINFSFDMSKYANNTDQQTQNLTAGKLFAAPNSDGSFNKSAGAKDSSDAFKITMYDSSNLVDPYSTTAGLDRESTSKTSPLRQALHAEPDASYQNGQSTQSGMTAADYAVINAKNEQQLDNMGTTYPTYTNFTSWTGAIVPYDRMHWNDADQTSDSKYTDTLHSDGKLGSDVKNRTATPDPANDGILANSETPFTLIDQEKYRAGEKALEPQYSTDGTLSQAGIITPERYANVYQLYDYTKSTPTVDVHVDNYATDKPSVTANGGKNLASSTSKSITGDLDGQKWHYTGTMGNGLPLADATINLQQSLKPTLNLSLNKLIFVPYSEVQGDNHLTQKLGSWRDPLSFAKGDDHLTMHFDGYSSEQMAEADLGGNTNSHTVTGDWSENTTLNDSVANSAHMDVDADQNVKPEYQLPVKNNENDNFFFGSGTLKRDNTKVQIVNGYSLANGADDTATDNYFLLLDREKPTDLWYDADKKFQENNETSTIHYLQNGDKEVHVVVNVKPRAGSNKPGDTSMIIRIPKVQQDNDNVGATIANFKLTKVGSESGVTSDNPLNTTLNPITDENVNEWLKDNFTSFDVNFTSPPQTFTYEYDYEISNQANIPLRTAYKDLIMDANTKTGSVRAVSNAVEFDKLKSANLMHVPSFDFGTNSIPSGQATYGLTDSDKAKLTTDSYFTVHSNNNNTSNWTLFDTLDSFGNANGSSSHDDFTLALGWPQLYDSSKPGFVNESDMEKAAENVPTDKYTDSNWRYANHYPFDLISNNHQNQLFRLDRTYGDKDNKETDLSRYYTGATLTVPAGETPSITSGKYTANLTYLLSDDGTLN